MGDDVRMAAVGMAAAVGGGAMAVVMEKMEVVVLGMLLEVGYRWRRWLGRVGSDRNDRAERYIAIIGGWVTDVCATDAEENDLHRKVMRQSCTAGNFTPLSSYHLKYDLLSWKEVVLSPVIPPTSPAETWVTWVLSGSVGWQFAGLTHFEQ